LAAAVVFSGTFGAAEAVPDEQDTVTGRPMIPELVEENVQLEEWATVAETVTVPPVHGTGEGVAVSVVTEGAGGALTVMVSVLEALLVPALAVSFTL